MLRAFALAAVNLTPLLWAGRPVRVTALRYYRVPRNAAFMVAEGTMVAAIGV